MLPLPELPGLPLPIPASTSLPLELPVTIPLPGEVTTQPKNKSRKLKVTLLIVLVSLAGVGYYAYSNNLF